MKRTKMKIDKILKKIIKKIKTGKVVKIRGERIQFPQSSTETNLVLVLLDSAPNSYR